MLDQVIEADTPEVVRMTTPAYYPHYLQPQSSYVTDDLHYRMRPNLEAVTSRDYSQYGPLNWSWADFTRHRRDSEWEEEEEEERVRCISNVRKSVLLWPGQLQVQSPG